MAADPVSDALKALRLKTSWTWQYDPVHTISNWCVRCHSKPYLHDPNTMMQMKANKDTWEEVREIEEFDIVTPKEEPSQKSIEAAAVSANTAEAPIILVNSPGKEARPDQASAAEEAFQEPPEQQAD